MTITTPANRRIVVAATYRDFKRYVDHEADPRLLHEYASSETVLLGRTFAGEQIVFLDGWEEHPKALQIHDQIKLRLALNGSRK